MHRISAPASTLLCQWQATWPSPELEAQWDALAARVEGATVFQSAPWQRAIALLLCRDGYRLLTVAHEGKLLAALPLDLASDDSLLTPGDQVADYLSPLIDNSAALYEPCWRAVLTLLQRMAPRVRCITFANLPESARCRTILPRLGVEYGFTVEEQESPGSCAIPLAGSWEQYLAQLRPHDRKEIRRKLERFNEAGDVHFNVTPQLNPSLSTPESAEMELARALEMMQTNNVGKQHTTRTLLAPFLKIAGPTLLGRGQLSVARLDLNRKPAAYGLVLQGPRGPMLFNCAADHSLPGLSPGVVLIARLIRDAIERLGAGEFDLLRGIDAYKRRLGAITRKMLVLRLFPSEASTIRIDADAEVDAFATKEEPREQASALQQEQVKRAWKQLNGREPQLVEDMDGSLRLVGAGLGGGSVIAMRCNTARAARLRFIYEKALPDASAAAIHYFGSADADDRSQWIFVAEATGPRYQPLDAQCRRQAARWAARVHLWGATQPASYWRRLPHRDERFMHRRLVFSARVLEKQRSDSRFLSNVTEEDLPDLERLQNQFGLILRHWYDVKTWLQGVPETLVHGSFTASNLRLVGEGPDTSLLVTGWQDAAWASPAIDLIQFDRRWMTEGAGVDLDEYYAAVRPSFPSLSRLAIDRLARTGRLFWIINALHTDIAWLNPLWPHRNVSHLRLYTRELEPLIESMGWDD